MLYWREVVFSEDRVVCVLVDEVTVGGKHIAVRCPAEVGFCLLLIHDVIGEDVGCSAVPEEVRVEGFFDAGALEVAREKVSYGVIP